MSNRRALFSEADAARALRAAAKAGVAAVVEIKPDGTIRIIPANVDNGDIDIGGTRQGTEIDL